MTDEIPLCQPASKTEPENTTNIDGGSNRDEIENDEDIARHRWLSMARPTWKVIEEPADTTTTRGQDWNYPKSNIWKTLATFWGFFVMGANDSASGPLVPYLQGFYGLSYITVSIIFLSPLLGYVVAALVDGKINQFMGRRGVAIICPSCHIIAYFINCFHPPYPVLIFTLALAGMGNGLSDSAWNSWASGMKHNSQILGCLHAAFGLGAVMTPLVLTTIVSQGEVPWYYFYYAMIGCAVIELISSTAAFWDSGAVPAQYLSANLSEKKNNFTPGGLRDTLFRRSSARTVWITSAFLFIYAGIELGIAGWIVTFMRDARGGGSFESGLTAAWFWLGLSVGRMTLGFITPLIGERPAITIYIFLEVIFGIIIHVVHNFYVAAVATALQGFFLGPLFPAVIFATVRLLPEEKHSSAIGVSTGLCSLGSSLLPFFIGVVAETHGVALLQPFIIALSGSTLLLWLCLPRIPMTRRLGSKKDAYMHHTYYHGA